MKSDDRISIGMSLGSIAIELGLILIALVICVIRSTGTMAVIEPAPTPTATLMPLPTPIVVPSLKIQSVLADVPNYFSDEEVEEIIAAYRNDAAIMMPRLNDVRVWYVEFVLDNNGRVADMQYEYKDGEWIVTMYGVIG